MAIPIYTVASSLCAIIRPSTHLKLHKRSGRAWYAKSLNDACDVYSVLGIGKGVERPLIVVHGQVLAKP